MLLDAPFAIPNVGVTGLRGFLRRLRLAAKSGFSALPTDFLRFFALETCSAPRVRSTAIPDHIHIAGLEGME